MTELSSLSTVVLANRIRARPGDEREGSQCDDARVVTVIAEMRREQHQRS